MDSNFAAAERPVSMTHGNQLRAGAATTDVTPWPGVSINGKLHDRTVTSIHDKLHARSLALDNGEERFALLVVDNCAVPREVFDNAKQQVEKQTGWPSDHIMMSATHTHSAPTVLAAFQSEPDPRYLRFLAERIAEAVIKAIGNLRPARAGWGVGRVPEYAFCRRGKMRPGTTPLNPFGGSDQAMMYPPPGSTDFVGFTGPVDPSVSFLSVQTADGRALALLANYSLHYVGGVPDGEVSADYRGAFAARIERLLGNGRDDPSFVGIMSYGAGGDVFWIDARRPFQSNGIAAYERVEAVGNRLAEEVLRVYPTVEHHDRVPLGVRQIELELGVRLPSRDEITAGRSLIAETSFPSSREEIAGNSDARRKLYARETVRMSDWPARVSVPLQAIRIGELAILAVPGEVFGATGLELRRRSPFQPTFTIGLANGAFGYLPPLEQFQLGGYETWRVRTNCLETQAEPKIVETLVGLLTTLTPQAASVSRRTHREVADGCNRT